MYIVELDLIWNRYVVKHSETGSVNSAWQCRESAMSLARYLNEAQELV